MMLHRLAIIRNLRSTTRIARRRTFGTRNCHAKQKLRTICFPRRILNGTMKAKYDVTAIQVDSKIL